MTSVCPTWCLVYIEYPNRLRTDQRFALTSERWKHLTDLNGTQLLLCVIKACSSWSIWEQCHEPLRQTYRQVRFTHPTVDPQYILRNAIKAINDTMGENGLEPSRLVVRTFLRFPIWGINYLVQKQRMETVKAAQVKMSTIIANRLMSKTLKRNIPLAAKRSKNV